MKELIEILTILSKYHPDAGIAEADHDVIYELGVFEQDGSWVKFV